MRRHRNNAERLTLRVPKGMKKAAAAVAKAKGITLSDAGRDAMAEWLERNTKK